MPKFRVIKDPRQHGKLVALTLDEHRDRMIEMRRKGWPEATMRECADALVVEADTEHLALAKVRSGAFPP